MPDGWVWARLGEIGRDWGQKTPNDDFTYLDVSAIDSSKGKIASPKVLSADEAPSRARKKVAQGTIIYSTVRPYLQNICVIDKLFKPEAIASTAFAILHPLQQMSGDFFALYLRSPAFIKYVESVQTGIAYPAINDKQFFSGLTPVPPHAEALRIMDKVNELMALCDQLEQQQTNNITAHQALVDALLATLTQSITAEEVTENWTRIAEHFDTLFTTDHSIEQLKQTVLQLAVMGRLVPQDDSDEPASVLLEKIAAEKAQLVKEKKIKKQRPLPAIADEEKLFPLPKGWEWVRFGSLVNIRAELVKSTEHPDFDQVAPDSIEKGTGRLLERRTVKEAGVKGPNNRFYHGQVLYSKIRPSLSKAIVAEFDGLCSADMYPMESMINPQYLLKLILSEVFLQQVRLAENRIKMPKLNIESLSKILVPLACTQQHEQIANKVDELNVLCDVLKSQIHQTQTTQLNLANAIVEKAVT